MAITYQWRGDFDSAELEALHGEGFDHEPIQYDWRRQVQEHSLGWVCACSDGLLVGFVNVAWDGAAHAFILDTLVSKAHRKRGIGTELVSIARTHAKEAGCDGSMPTSRNTCGPSTSIRADSRRSMPV
jgi:GNAT superfamily N-acetyltransferase